MPLKKSKSKRAFEENLKTELAAGRPRDQALAIAYSTQRAASGRSSKPKSKSKRKTR